MPKNRRHIVQIADRHAQLYLDGRRVDERYGDDDLAAVADVPFGKVILENQHITRLPPFQPTLETLTLDNCTSLASLAGIERLVGLRSLQLVRLPALDFEAVVPVLEALPGLTELTLGGESLRTLPVLRLPRLLDLTLRLTKDLDLARIAEIATLKNLHLPETQGAIDFTPLAHLEVVDISATNLGDVDDSLGRLANVQKLWLTSCKIASLPPTIGKLQKLCALDLRWTEIPELPDEICECAALYALNISDTPITVLPANIGKLSKLHRLDANTKKLKVVPESVGDLANLRHISIPYRHTKVPASFYNLTLESFFGPPAIGEKLTLLKPATPRQDRLWLHEGDRLPDDFGDPIHLDFNLGPDHAAEVPQLSKLPRLESLSLCTGNLVDAFRRLAAGSPRLHSVSVHNVRTLPDELGELVQLTTLEINKHSGDEALRIDALPKTIGRLVRLQELSLGWHALKQVPDEIGDLAALETFHLWHPTEVRALPETIGKLHNLKTLTIFPELEHLPESIIDCPIESLRVRGGFGTDCKIDNLPILGKIRTLKVLTLSGLAGLPLAEILDAFAGHRLETLDLEWAKIDELPPQIGKLVNLRKLVVRSTDITAFPPELRNCTELRHLGLSMYRFDDTKALKAQLPNGRWKHVRSNSEDAYVRSA